MNPPISEADFNFISLDVRNRTGLVLTPDKQYLLETRLTPIARREGYPTVPDLLSAVRMRRDQRILALIADALTTNETFFFRDKTPFDALRDHILPDLIRKRGGGKLRLWCAACSTGQEPYSIAMLMAELRAQGKGCDLEIVASDVSDRVLEKARAGLFSQFEVQRGLPIQLLMKHFEKSGDMWRINERIRGAVKFVRHNLLEDPRALGRFDIVFCRNVLIYFELEQKRRTLEQIAAIMPEDGALLLGAAETVTGVTDAFLPAPERRAYCLRNAAWRRAA